MAPYIETKDLVKRFRNINALDHLSITWDQGKIHGIIGRNGSGKTVLLKCLCGFMKPTEGSIIINGDIVKCGVRQHMGVIIEVPAFIEHKSAFKNLTYLYCLNNKPNPEKIKQVLTRVGLDPDNNMSVGKYSLGMRQRLGIAQAIMEDEPLLLLDEPMNGLDNQGVKEIREVLLKLREEGKTIVLASHSKEDIAVLCDTVTELDHGKIISYINASEAE